MQKGYKMDKTKFIKRIKTENVTTKTDDIACLTWYQEDINEFVAITYNKKRKCFSLNTKYDWTIFYSSISLLEFEKFIQDIDTLWMGTEQRNLLKELIICTK